MAYQSRLQTSQNRGQIGEICDTYGDDDSLGEYLLPVLKLQFESGALSTQRCHLPIFEIGYKSLLKGSSIFDKCLELNWVANVAVLNSLLATIFPQRELRFGIGQ